MDNRTMVPHPPSYRTLASLSRINLLHQLQQRGTMTVGDLAEATGLHPNTTREHLDRLIGEGFVTCEPEQRDIKGRPRMLYSAATGVDHQAGSIRVAKVDAALRRADQVRRMLPVEPIATAACIHSPLQRQLDALDDHLDQSGFEAQLDEDGLHIHLHDCPYYDMVKAHPEVCDVHFRLLQGVLDQADGPLTAQQLHPLVGPNTCTLDLHSTDHSTGPGTDPSADPEAPNPQPATAIIIHGVLTL